MDISIVIVNYNVKYFLEQALYSIRKAQADLAVEVIVVDNASSDASVGMVLEKFPEVQLIQNQKNVGFSVANNQGFAVATGKYVLILNPDTVLQETTLSACFKKMESDAEIGALGVRMIDGSGQFLPESKRGLPTPLVALFKMSGLYKLFPTSAYFNAYYAGHIDEKEEGCIDVLAGAFMFVKKSTLDEVGGFDETFFMYGEDIDLSYRIQQKSLKILYFPSETIIHYKGESTKKSSIKYIRHFYEAMLIFTNKHFPGRLAFFFKILVYLGIWGQALIAFIKNGFNLHKLLLLDSLLFCSMLLLTKHVWASWYFQQADYYQASFYYFNIPLYTFIWLLCIKWLGGYDKPLRLAAFVKGLLMGSLIILAIYGLLDTQYRSSRSIILLATLLNTMTGYAYRKTLFRKILFGRKPPRTLFVGANAEKKRAEALLKKAGIEKNLVGRIATDHIAADQRQDTELGELSDLEDIVALHHIEEVIFCAKSMSNQSMMNWMTRLGSSIQTRIFPEQGQAILSSFSKNELGEIYTISVRFALQTPAGQRQKRLFDLLVSSLYILLFPFLCWKYEYRRLFAAAFKILMGRMTWIGYTATEGLPPIKPYAFDVVRARQANIPQEIAQRLYFMYARAYSFEKDVQILWKIFVG